jgi:hypothetical protein
VEHREHSVGAEIVACEAFWWARGGGKFEGLLLAGRHSIVSKPKLASTCNLRTSGNPPVHS